MRARHFSRDKIGCDPPEMGPAGSEIDRLSPIRQARDYPGNVGVDDRFRKFEGKAGDCARGITSDARQPRDFHGIRWEATAKAFEQMFRRRLKVSRAGVISKTLPGMKNVTFRARGECFEAREAFEPAPVIGNHARDLGLLEHEL